MIGFALVGFIVLLVISNILNGWVLSLLWSWFFVPTLGLPHLSVIQAIGVAMVITYLTTHRGTESDDSNKSSTEKFVEAVIFAFFYPLFALFFGWIVHLFM